jgi:hypothetical protein
VILFTRNTTTDRQDRTSAIIIANLKPTLLTITNEIERLLGGETAKVVDMRIRRKASNQSAHLVKS